MIGLNLNLDPQSWFSGGDSDTASNDARFMNDFAWKQSLRNEQLQRDQFQFNKDLATHGIRMRAADAEAAGFHPLVGAGVNPAMGSSNSFGGTSFVGAHSSAPKSSPFSLGFSQSISRAKAATMTEQEKVLAAAELARIQASTAESHARIALAQREMSLLGKTPPIPSKYQQVTLPSGGFENVYSPDYSQAIMSDPLGMWANSFKKAFGGPDSRPFWGAVKRGAKRSLFLD